MSKPTADWERVADQYYRKVQLYTSIFDEDLELENYLISGAPYSGALALSRDVNKVFAYRTAQESQTSIDIYNYAGKLITRINWDKGVIKGLGWSEDERLLVVSQDGTVRCYTGLSDDFTPFTLGHGSEEYGVVECRFWLSGFVARLGNNQLVSVTSYDEPRPRLLATPPSDNVVSWAVIPPAYTLSRTVEVLLAIGQTINVVDATESEDRMLQNGPFRHICVSPNGKFIALYTDDGKVWVISRDFQDKLSEYATKAKTIPKDMQWCGSDSVVLAWEDEVHMVGPNAVASKYYYEDWVHIIPDVDGARLITNSVCEFLQKVPDVTEDIFKLGSISPASVLLDAVEELERKSSKADDNIQLIKPNLVDAVDSCIAAAGHEFSIHWQKQLLKAASFGKTILDLYDGDAFVNMCETIRVLNAVRFYEIGLPLSYDQYFRLGPERLIQRLVNRREYLVALRLSEYLNLPTDRIYVHWACQKVRAPSNDEDAVCQVIVEKLNGKAGISFEEIAKAAYDEGRQGLATSLLNYERRAGKQVPLLLSMEEDTIALDKAIESGDTDLVLYVLLHLKAKLPLASFFRTINSRPVASALVESTAFVQDRNLLKDLYYQDDRRTDGSNLLVGDAFQLGETHAKLDKLRSASKLLQDTKESTFQARSIDEAQRLLRLHDALDTDDALREAAGVADGDRFFAGKSLNETLFHLIRLGTLQRAAKVQANFKIPERTFWWLRLRGLVAKRDWRELEEIGTRNKRSPIGWEAFYNEVLGAGNSKLAGIFVTKCTNQTGLERAEMYVKCGLIVKAAEEAAKVKDLEYLEGLRSKAAGRDLNEVDKMIGVVKKGR